MIDRTDVPNQIQSFYDRYPYPRPVETLDQYRQTWQDPERRRADFHLHWPHHRYRENFSILIAGCGTSQAAKHAIRWPAAEVTAIDLSATSVNCTEDLKRKYNLTNLEVRQLPIDQVGDLGKSFDQIICTGVLHHLPNPDEGLASLRHVLNADGAMHLMLYAPYGRTGIYMIQEFCRRLGIQATDKGISELIAALHLLPAAHPLASLLREAPDFQHEAALADALLHPQDRAYSVPQFFDFIEKGQMMFGRWVRQAAYSPRCGLMARIPQRSMIAELPLPQQFAAAELFRGDMVRHSAILYRDDCPDNTGPLRFKDCEHYVPIPMAETVCIQERLPAGAAAVLINRNHSYRDIFLPISKAEKCLFDAIDGARTIGDILKSAAVSDCESGLSFFEQIWWHDQIVFDTSHR